jgi:hypothetical protein
MSALNWLEERLVWSCLGRFELGSGVECFLVLPPSDRTPREHPNISRTRSIKTHALNHVVQSPGATTNTLFPDACRKSIYFIDFVDRPDVRMVQRGRGSGLPLKAVKGLCIVGEFFGQELQGDVPT